MSKALRQHWLRLVIFMGLTVMGLWVGRFLWSPKPDPRIVTAVHQWTRTEEHLTSDRDLFPEEINRRERAAIKALGVKAIPVLRQELQHKGLYHKVYYALAKKIPSVQRWRWLPKPTLPFRNAEQVRLRAAIALGMFGSEAITAIPDLLRHCAETNPFVRVTMAIALGEIGVASAEVKQALSKMAADHDPYVALCAATSLWQIDPNNVEMKLRIQTILPLIQRPIMLSSLRRLGPKGQPLVPVIEETIRKCQWTPLRMALVLALWDITLDKERILKEFQNFGAAVTNQYTDPPQPNCDQALSYAVKHEWMKVPEFRQAMIPLLQIVATNKAAIVLPQAPDDN